MARQLFSREEDLLEYVKAHMEVLELYSEDDDADLMGGGASDNEVPIKPQALDEIERKL